MIPYRELFIEFERAELQYLVAGGFAVNFHQVQRATVDLDLILRLEPNNIRKFVSIMTTAGFKPRAPVDAVDLADEMKRQEWIKSKGMMVFSFFHSANPFEIVDVFIDEPKPFELLDQGKLVVEAFGVKIKVLGKKDLIEMKKSAGRDKDLFDISQLVKLDDEK